MELVFFLEEPSAKAMLQGIIPRLLPGIETRYIVFEGKQDLEKRLPIRLRAWQNPESCFLVMRDQDSGDCLQIKQRLVTLCSEAGHPDAIVRIACHELESFYLGDLKAVAQALGPASLAKQQTKAKYRTPDRLNNAAQELKRIAPKYQKLSGSRALGLAIALEGNHSQSYNQLLAGIKKACGLR